MLRRNKNHFDIFSFVRLTAILISKAFFSQYSNITLYIYGRPTRCIATIFALVFYIFLKKKIIIIIKIYEILFKKEEKQNDSCIINFENVLFRINYAIILSDK